MKKLITFMCAMAFLSAGAIAQNITVSSAVGQSPATFIQNNLLGGGVYVFNAKFSNSTGNISTPNIGTFQANGFDGLSMASGIIMTTGNIDVAPGPNNATSSSNPLNGFYSDPEIAAVATNTVNGCATLDFDFVTLASSVQFNYTFASEEYPEFVCSNFNDVFVFFVTGPDPETGEEVTRNIAIIPNTVTDSTPNGIAVAVNSVNQGTTTNSGGTGCYFDYSGYYSMNCADSNGTPSYEDGIQYDGYTTKLTAETAVLPCQVYHMHISVCNIGDNSYDSGVFLEGNSFSAPTMAIGLSRPGVTPVHGSCPTEIPLTLAETQFDEGVVHFGFGGSAVLGVDYEIVDENGVAIGADGLVINNEEHSFVLRGIQGADLSQEKTIELYLATSLCTFFPQLVTYDTMRFSLDHGGDVMVKDTTITCTQACFEVGTELVYGTNVTYQWVPATGLDDPYSLVTTAMIFESTDYMLIATGGSGCNSDTAYVHVVITNGNPDIPVSIDEVDGGSISVYPNPAHEVIYIKASDVQRVEVFTREGRKVYEQSYNNYSGTLNIPTEGMAAGVYGVRVSTAGGANGAKIVINK